MSVRSSRNFLSSAYTPGREGRNGARRLPSPCLSQAGFGRLLEEQLFEYALLERDEESALLRHEYLETVFGLRRIGRLLVGVEGAENRERALDCLGRLGEVIEG